MICDLEYFAYQNNLNGARLFGIWKLFKITGVSFSIHHH